MLALVHLLCFHLKREKWYLTNGLEQTTHNVQLHHIIYPIETTHTVGKTIDVENGGSSGYLKNILFKRRHNTCWSCHMFQYMDGREPLSVAPFKKLIL